jgi:hypothetical protein
MKTAPTTSNLRTDFNYGNVFAVERKNDFLVIMRLVIASTFILAIAVLVF